MFKPQWFCPLCNSRPEKHELFARVIGEMAVSDKQKTAVPIVYQICTECSFVFAMLVMDEKTEAEYYNGNYRITVQGTKSITERVLKEQNRRTEYLMPRLAGYDKLEGVKFVKKHLDVGSSTGVFLKATKEKYECEILGIEPGEDFREESGVPSLASIDDLLEEDLHTFDFISIIHVLEHIQNPGQMLQTLRNDWVTNNGRLLIEVPDLYNERSLHISHPVAFTIDTLIDLLHRTGWNPIWIIKYHSYKTGYPAPPNILALCEPVESVLNESPIKWEHVLSDWKIAQKELSDHARVEEAKAKDELGK